MFERRSHGRRSHGRRSHRRRSHGRRRHRGHNDFALIVVLFILLIIVGTSFVAHRY